MSQEHYVLKTHLEPPYHYVSLTLCVKTPFGAFLPLYVPLYTPLYHTGTLHKENTFLALLPLYAPLCPGVRKGI